MNSINKTVAAFTHWRAEKEQEINEYYSEHRHIIDPWDDLLKGKRLDWDPGEATQWIRQNLETLNRWERLLGEWRAIGRQRHNYIINSNQHTLASIRASVQVTLEEIKRLKREKAQFWRGLAAELFVIIIAVVLISLG